MLSFVVQNFYKTTVFRKKTERYFSHLKLNSWLLALTFVQENIFFYFYRINYKVFTNFFEKNFVYFSWYKLKNFLPIVHKSLTSNLNQSYVYGFYWNFNNFFLKNDPNWAQMGSHNPFLVTNTPFFITSSRVNEPIKVFLLSMQKQIYKNLFFYLLPLLFSPYVASKKIYTFRYNYLNVFDLFFHYISIDAFFLRIYSL